jgi:urease accessory protein UreF
MAQGWRCLECGAEFGPLTPSDRRASLKFLEQQARTLATAADRLDGAGFWAVSKAVWHANEAIERLARAIAHEDSGDPETQ